MHLHKLIENKNLDFTTTTCEHNLELIKIKDELYISFMKNYNGGYFYNNSLLIFGLSNKEEQFNIIHMNNILNKNYKNIVNNLYFFAQDIFGNLFAFDNKNIVFFNIETGEREVIADDFKSWLLILYDDLDYYTGESLTEELKHIEKIQLIQDKRLCPKYPFVLGGEYEMDNLILKTYIDNILYNSSIAKQIDNLPDGSKVKIIINNE